MKNKRIIRYRRIIDVLIVVNILVGMLLFYYKAFPTSIAILAVAGMIISFRREERKWEKKKN